MANDKKPDALGCTALLLCSPFIYITASLWEAYVIHRIWVWHLSDYLTPWPVHAIAAVLVVRASLTYRSRPENDKPIAEVLVGAIFASAFVPALALLAGWVFTW